MSHPNDVPSLIAEAKRLEASIDFNKANEERRELLSVLGNLLEREDLEKLVLALKEFKDSQSGETSLENVKPEAKSHKIICEMCDRYQVDWEPYKEFQKNIRYVDTILQAITPG
jgi:hypothetical protein